MGDLKIAKNHEFSKVDQPKVRKGLRERQTRVGKKFRVYWLTGPTFWSGEKAQFTSRNFL